jgi:hypothetical protein
MGGTRTMAGEGHFLVRGPAFGVEHSGGGEGVGIDCTHRTFGVVEDDVIGECFHDEAVCYANIHIFLNFQKYMKDCFLHFTHSG